jgi:hypothetical protein
MNHSRIEQELAETFGGRLPTAKRRLRKYVEAASRCLPAHRLNLLAFQIAMEMDRGFQRSRTISRINKEINQEAWRIYEAPINPTIAEGLRLLDANRAISACGPTRRTSR